MPRDYELRINSRADAEAALQYKDAIMDAMVKDNSQCLCIRIAIEVCDEVDPILKNAFPCKVRRFKVQNPENRILFQLPHWVETKPPTNGEAAKPRRRGRPRKVTTQDASSTNGQ